MVKQEDGSQQKLDKFLSANNLNEILANTTYVPEKQEIKFSADKLSDSQRQDKAFTKHLGMNQLDEDADNKWSDRVKKINNPEPKNALQMGI